MNNRPYYKIGECVRLDGRGLYIVNVRRGSNYKWTYSLTSYWGILRIKGVQEYRIKKHCQAANDSYIKKLKVQIG